MHKRLLALALALSAALLWMLAPFAGDAARADITLQFNDCPDVIISAPEERTVEINADCPPVFEPPG